MVTEPIEILFLDVLKAPKIVDFVVQSYFPRLIPGVSIVIQQDYFFPELPMIKVAQEYFRDYFDYVGEVCSSAVFRLKEAIPQEEADRFAQSKPDGEAQLRLSSIAMQRSIDPFRRMLMALSRARLMVEVRGAEAARDYMRQIAEEFPVQYEDKYWKKNQLAIESAQAFIKKQLPQAV